MVTIVGYHGTNRTVSPLIIQNNFKVGNNKNDWFGSGVYFFIEGINCKPAEDLAQQWAIDQSNKGNYKNYSVLEATIETDDSLFLDLTDHDVLCMFNKLREAIIKEQNAKGVVYKLKNESVFWELISKEIIFNVVSGNVYIEFGVCRAEKIFSRTPNCTILAVKDILNSTIENSIKEIKEIKEGETNNE